jgi:hypothetical protein
MPTAPRFLLIAVLFTDAAQAQGLKTGNLLVANQEDASASLIDLRTDAMKLIPAGIGPHEAQISPSGRVGVVTIYGQQPAGNQLVVAPIGRGLPVAVTAGEIRSARPPTAASRPR